MYQKIIIKTAVAAMFAMLNAAIVSADPVITVDASRQLGQVNRLVFGHNIEAADGRGIFSEAPGAASFDKGGIKYGQGFWSASLRKPYAGTLEFMQTIKPGMLRYPGGCLAHNYDWKKAVGPLKERGDWQFGIDEYIRLCREMKVEPLFTVTDYALPAEQLPRHAAELVEYLNAPATADHPWAMKRKEWGNPEPYGVKWFELGNETDHGNHHCVPRRQYSPAEYVKYFNSVAAAMRAVDPAIKLGAVTVPGYGSDFDCAWNMAVYKGACPNADFVVVHFYGPGVDNLIPADCLKTAMAYADQLEFRLGKYRELIKQESGRELPLAVTEFNIGSVKDEPTFYRFSYTAGLLCADLMRLWLNPDNKIATANYWHVLNGFWGMAKSDGGKINDRKAALPFFQLWGNHFGEVMVMTTVADSPREEAPAAPGLEKSSGMQQIPAKRLADCSLEPFRMNGFNSDGVSAVSPKATELTVDFKNRGKQFFAEFSSVGRPAPSLVPVGKAYIYQLSFDGRFIPAPGNQGKPVIGLGLCDNRGWEKTKSAIAVLGVEHAGEWKHFEGRFLTMDDCSGANVLVRMENATIPVSGKFEVKNLKVEFFSENVVPAYAALTSCSALSKDGRKLYVMVFNKSFDKAITAKIELKGAKTVGLATAFELYLTDYAGRDYFSPVKSSIEIKNNELNRIFPPHSMTAIEINLQ